MTLAKSPTLKTNENTSIISFYSSLGSVNIENYYLHKKEKSFSDLQKVLREKGWEEFIINDICKLVRSFMNVEISLRNWTRFFSFI